MLVAILFGILVAVFGGSGPLAGGRELGNSLARKWRCAAVGPGPCWRDPLTIAYGRGPAGAVRSLAPAPAGRDGLLPVDFRTCRRASCASGNDGAALTVSNRRTTAFTSIQTVTGQDGGGGALITYWLYRPGQAWEEITRRVSADEIRTLARRPLLDSDVPRLVPLETLAGRNHMRFTAAEEPPWRWQVESRSGLP